MPQKRVVKRRDGSGTRRDRPRVQRMVIAIVAKLSGVRRRDITPATRFEEDLGWDEIYKLKVITPVKQKLHVQVDADHLTRKVRRVGQLVDHVWSLMEPV